jgi:tRNA pseudouridine55 synthase
MSETAGYLLIDKPKGKTAFHLVAVLRKLLGIKKIGHSGTLDPMATGVMVMLIGREYTKLSDQFLSENKEYLAKVHLGIETDTYDAEGQSLITSSLVPTLEDIKKAIADFQGEIEQIPPMFSAKKINGQKLYHLARQGKTVERAPVRVKLETELLSYEYPFIDLRVNCSKGTYIRSLAHDLGRKLKCGAHLTELVRTRSGSFHLRDCLNLESLYSPDFDVRDFIYKKP